MDYLKTERLHLRPFRMDDLEDFYEYAKVPGVGEQAGWPYHKNLEESKVILELFIKHNENFAVVENRSNKVIGSIGLHDRPFDKNDDQYKQREIGYVLAKDYWGQGLMTEAVKAVMRYAFKVLTLDRITVGHFIENCASQRVIEKLGFTYVYDDKYYATLLKKEFDEKKYVLYKENFTH